MSKKTQGIENNQQSPFEQIIDDNPEMQENLCLVGGIPIIVGFADSKYPYGVRLQAAHFIKKMCSTSSLTLQMFISCRGLDILSSFLAEDYDQHKELIRTAVDGILNVFELQVNRMGLLDIVYR
jgi:hypothetical protein